MGITTIKFEPQNKEELYKMKCQKCGKHFKSKLINHYNGYQCTNCAYINDEKCFTKKTKTAYDIKVKKMNDIAKKWTEILKDKQCYNIEILGKYGWSLYYSDLIDEYTKFGETNFSLPQEIKQMEENGKLSINDIDSYIANFINEKCFQEIKIRIINENVDDKIKINNLFEDFDNEKFYECANILFELIDAKIITINLYDYYKGKYSIYQDNDGNYKSKNGDGLCKKKTGKPNIGQGWEAFSITFKNNFKSFFNSKDFNPHKGEYANEEGIKRMWTKEELFDEFVNKAKSEMDKNIGYEFLNIAYPLLIFFNDNDWLDYSNKPQIINRNWLMHGMYKYKNITKIDCIKLILFYYQFTSFLDSYWDL